MNKYFTIIRQFLHLSFQREMTYRADFFMWIIVMIGWFCFNLTFWHILFANITLLGGWTKGQVFVLQGFFFLLEFTIWGIFNANFHALPTKINRGEIDLFLTRPMNTQVLLSFNDFSLDHLVNFVLGIATIMYGLSVDQITPTILDILAATSIFIIANIFVYSLYFMSICLSFWFDRLANINYLVPGIRAFARVPQSAYKGVSFIFLSYIVPAALIGTVPAQALLGHFRPYETLYLLLFGLLTLKLSQLVFAAGLRRYSSASS